MSVQARAPPAKCNETIIAISVGQLTGVVSAYELFNVWYERTAPTTKMTVAK